MIHKIRTPQLNTKCARLYPVFQTPSNGSDSVLPLPNLPDLYSPLYKPAPFHFSPLSGLPLWSQRNFSRDSNSILRFYLVNQSRRCRMKRSEKIMFIWRSSLNKPSVTMVSPSSFISYMFLRFYNVHLCDILLLWDRL